MSLDNDEVTLTDFGRQVLRNPDGIKLDHLLFIEILARIGGTADGNNVDDLTDELIDRFGSAEAALVAVKCGKVGFQKGTQQ